MSLFWDYFRNTLRFPPILRPGPLAMLAEGAALGLDAARNVILQLRDQFLPEKCEDVYLARYARSRGIVRAPLEPEGHYQARIRLAYLWWRRGGRASAMKQVLVSYFGFARVDIINLRTEDPDRWAEFRVVCELVGEQPIFTLDQVVWAINEIKPAGKKLAEVLFVASAIGDVPAWSIGLYAAGVTTVYPEPE